MSLPSHPITPIEGLHPDVANELSKWIATADLAALRLSSKRICANVSYEFFDRFRQHWHIELDESSIRLLQEMALVENAARRMVSITFRPVLLGRPRMLEAMNYHMRNKEYIRKKEEELRIFKMFKIRLPPPDQFTDCGSEHDVRNALTTRDTQLRALYEQELPNLFKLMMTSFPNLNEIELLLESDRVRRLRNGALFHGIPLDELLFSKASIFLDHNFVRIEAGFRLVLIRNQASLS